MSDNWDFYELKVDDQPAFIFLDLEARANGELLPENMAYARVRMRDARPDGLSSASEFDTLIAIEDALERLVSDGCRYVGRCTTAGNRDFYFYDASPANWSGRVQAAMSAFPNYEVDTGFRHDPEAEVYESFLLPGPRDRERIENRRVCEALRRNGDSLEVSREIDHWVYFTTGATRDVYVAAANALGFAVRRMQSDDGRLQVQLFQSGIPSEDTSLELWQLAVSQGVHYDGWECEAQVGSLGRDNAV